MFVESTAEEEESASRRRGRQCSVRDFDHLESKSTMF